MTNPIEKMAALIRERWPAAKCQLDLDQRPDCSSYLDVSVGDYHLNIEMRPDQSLSLTGGREILFGEGADEHYPDFVSAKRRVIWLLDHRGQTTPTFSDQIRQLMVHREMSRAEIADRLEVPASIVASLESKGSTIGLRKLQELVAAMGGQLSLRISFADTGEEAQLLLGTLDTTVGVSAETPEREPVGAA